MNRIDIQNHCDDEKPLTVCQAAALVPCPYAGCTTRPSTLVRWIITGKRGVRLEGRRLSGKTWWTTKTALDRFFAAVTAEGQQDAIQRHDAAQKQMPQMERRRERETERRGREAGERLRQLVGGPA